MTATELADLMFKAAQDWYRMNGWPAPSPAISVSAREKNLHVARAVLAALEPEAPLIVEDKP